MDDMISTGNTLIAAADLLQKNGAEEVYVFATHGIFAGEAPANLQKSIIKRVTIADTIEVRTKRKFEKLHVVSVSPLIAEALKK